MKTKKTNVATVTPVKETAIVSTAATRELTSGIWAMIEKMAPVMYRAHLFGVTSIEQAAAIMLKGYECGFSMTASFDFVQIIDGKPSVKPSGAMALLLSNPLCKKLVLKRLTDDKGNFTGFECYMERSDKDFSHTGRFTLADAKRAGLTAGSDMGNGKIRQGHGNWEKYPENMCQWRAIGFAADVVFPDVTAGMTTLMKAPEMYGVALTEGGDVVHVVATNIDPLQELVTQYGAEAVMDANDGKIPVNGEIDAVRAKLEAAKVQTA